METTFLTCYGDARAMRLCADENCLNPSPLCQNKNCRCVQRHLNCMLNVQVKVINNNMNRRQNDYKQFDDQIVRFYDQTIKMIARQKQEYIDNMNNCTVLRGNEKKLWSKIKQGSSRTIVPKLVHYAIKSLSLKSTVNIDQMVNNIKLQTKIISQQFKTGLTKMREFWIRQPLDQQKQEQQIETILKFDNTLCHSNLLISQNKQKIKTINSSSGNYLFGLISPSLQDTITTKQIQLKIIKKISYFYIGICCKKAILSSNFEWIKDNGICMISSNGYTVNGYFQQQNRQSQNFKFSAGDIVKIIYQKQTKSIKFVNKKMKSSLRIKQQITDDFYFCVSLFSLGNEIEIVGEIHN